METRSQRRKRLEPKAGEGGPVDGDQVQNPLQNPLILELVFGFLAAKDLKACRQVSQFWHAHSLKAWRSTATVMLSPGNYRSKLESFTRFVEGQDYQYSGKPYTNFSLTRKGDVKKLWRVCGLHIKILNLSDVQFGGVQDFRNVIFKLCPSMEQLTLLNVQVSFRASFVEEPANVLKPWREGTSNLKRFTTNVDTRKLGISWMEILCNFPNLKALTLQGEKYRYASLFRSAKVIRLLDANMLNLKEIHTSFMYTRRFLNAVDNETELELTRFLQETNVRLESFSFCSTTLEPAIDLWEVASASSATLEKLTLDNAHNASLLPASPPSSCLSRLSNGLYENIEEIVLQSRVFRSLDFLRVTPNLKKLGISGDWNQNRNNILERSRSAAMTGVKLKDCTELQILEACRFSVRDVAKLVKWLPNIKKLTVSEMDNRLFAGICTSWPELEELRITRSSVDECAITGMERDVVEAINKGGDVDAVVRVKGGNIRALQHLRRVSMEVDDRSPFAITLGRSAAVHGFQQLPKLQHLRIAGYDLEAKELWEELLQRQCPWV